MANQRIIESVYLGPFSNIEQYHQNPPYKPGELGARVVVGQAGAGSKEYQFVQIDSGATSATPTGVLATGQILYWKNRSQYLVTNDSRFSDTASQGTRASVQPVAGILVNPSTSFPSVTVPAGLTAADCVYIQTRGRCTVALANTGNPGDFAVPQNSATVPQLTNVAPGTAPQDTLVGRFITAVSGGIATVDLQLPEIP